MPASSLTRDGASLKVEARSIGGVFEGRIAADRSSIDGTWTQGGGKLLLVLKPMKDQSGMERNRLQEPTGPCPHRAEDVSWGNLQGCGESLPGRMPFACRWVSQGLRIQTPGGGMLPGHNDPERPVRDRDAVRKITYENNFERQAGS
jgi:hypothetical protein